MTHDNLFDLSKLSCLTLFSQSLSKLTTQQNRSTDGIWVH